MKNEITSDQVLTHYNPDLPIILTTDASKHAVAGILSHKCTDDSVKPIAFISRSLSKAELNYSVLEKEAPAIIFSVTKLKQYLLGNTFILKTDHKPLIAIFGEKKGIPIMAAARMQRWALILSGFNYVIEHIKGHLNEADHLSRIAQTQNNSEENERSYVFFIQNHNNINLNFQSISLESRRDPIISKVCDAVKKGTLKNLKGPEFKPYLTKDIELTVEKDCLLWGYRVVIPTKLTDKVLKELHSSHLGVVKTKALARSYVWWPSINENIEKLIKSCIPCQELSSSPKKSSLIPWTPEQTISSRIHVDFAGPVHGYHLFVVIDSLSKWIEVFQTRSITSTFVVTTLRQLFARYGLVNTIVSDNGRQFTSDEFKNFVTLNRIKHILTAPGHPASNGQAEVFMKILKKSLYASLRHDKNKDFDLILNRFLMDYRNTIHGTTKETPSMLFLGRSIKTRFDLMRPPTAVEDIISSQEINVRNYKGSRNVEFREGQRVFIRDYTNPNNPSWSQASVDNKLGPRSYNCTFLHNNRKIKRHVDQINSAKIQRKKSHEDNNLSDLQGGEVQQLAQVSPTIEATEQKNENIENSKKTNENSDYKIKLRPRIEKNYKE